MNKISKAMKGYKTYAFLIVALLGFIGIGDIISEGEVGVMLDSLMEIVGILGAVYGRYVALPKE